MFSMFGKSPQTWIQDGYFMCCASEKTMEKTTETEINKQRSDVLFLRFHEANTFFRDSRGNTEIQLLDERLKIFCWYSLKTQSFQYLQCSVFYNIVSYANYFVIQLLLVECAKFCGSRTILNLVGLVSSCHLTFGGISWVRNFFSWAFHGSKKQSKVVILWVQFSSRD